MQPPSSQPIMIFCAAAHQDNSFLVQLETHLLPLQRAGRITVWSERHIAPGEKRNEEKTKHLKQADIIILLLSSDFFASDACSTLTAQALERSSSGQTRVIPLLLRPVAWRDTSLAQLSCLPPNERPITSWNHRDEAFEACVTEIRKLLNRSPATISAHEYNHTVRSGEQHQMASVLYNSCFIAYAHEDAALAQQLHNDLQAQGVQCWFALHDMKIGARIRPTIDQAIRQQDKLLLLVSSHSINSYWVEDEVEAALEIERREQREILFPIRLDESIKQTSQAWAATLRRTRHSGNFTNWTDPQAYQQSFDRLLKDLRRTDGQTLKEWQS